MLTRLFNNKTFIPLETTDTTGRTTEFNYLSLNVTAAVLNWHQKQNFAGLSSLHNKPLLLLLCSTEVQSKGLWCMF